LGVIMASFEVTVVRATNFCIGMFFDLTTLLPSSGLRGVRPLQFDPVDPDCWLNAIAVGSFCFIESIATAFSISRLAFLNPKFALRFDTDFDLRFDDLRVLDGAGNLVAAERQTGEPRRHAVHTLRMADLNEAT
jgi:hypothetical protein